jgi:hypothetical protein
MHQTNNCHSCALGAILLLALSSVHLRAQEKVEPSSDKYPKITVSKETNWFTEPLNEDGEVDFWDAANNHFSKGVTPENNLVTAIVETIAGYEATKRPEYRRRLYDELGLEQMSPIEELLIPLALFFEAKGENPDEVEYFDSLSERPWASSDYPIPAQWLEKYESRIERFVTELDKKTTCFCPLISNDKSFEISLDLAYNSSDLRQITHYLLVRSMSRLGNGDIAGCQTDLIAVRKICRLSCGSCQLHEVWVAFATLRRLAHAEAEMSLNKSVTVMHIEDYRNRIAKLPIQFDLVKHLDQRQRPFVLSTMIATKNGDNFVFEYDQPISRWALRSVRNLVDWDLILKRTNWHYDELCRQIKSQPLHIQLKKIEKYCNQFDEFEGRNEKWELTMRLFLANRVDKSLLTADLVINHAWDFEPDQVVRLLIQAKTVLELSTVNLALHQYHKEHGEFPKKLEDLKPAYLAQIPEDPYTGEALKYRLVENHFLLYSVGDDGDDDGINGHSALVGFGYFGPDYSVTSDPEKWHFKGDD